MVLLFKVPLSSKTPHILTIMPGNEPDLIDQGNLQRVEEICMQHFGVYYDDLDALKTAIKSCLLFAKQEGNLESVIAELQIVFIPNEPKTYEKPTEPYSVRIRRLLDTLQKPAETLSHSSQ